MHGCRHVASRMQLRRCRLLNTHVLRLMPTACPPRSRPNACACRANTECRRLGDCKLQRTTNSSGDAQDSSSTAESDSKQWMKMVLQNHRPSACASGGNRLARHKCHRISADLQSKLGETELEGYKPALTGNSNSTALEGNSTVLEGNSNSTVLEGNSSRTVLQGNSSRTGLDA